jgi:hypothetical protein
VEKNAPPEFSLDLDSEKGTGLVLTNQIAKTLGPILFG